MAWRFLVNPNVEATGARAMTLAEHGAYRASGALPSYVS
jgi:hypothetical protein